jgi:hypothetical protein
MTKVIKLPVSGKPVKRPRKPRIVPLAGQTFKNKRFGEGIILAVNILMEGDVETGYRITVRYRSDPPKVYREYQYPSFNIQKLVA